MNVAQTFNAFINWCLVDPSHLIVLGSAIAAITPTPNAGTLAGKIYKVIDLFALNFLHAKETGVTVPDVMTQIGTLLAQRPQSVSAPAAPTSVVLTPTPPATPNFPTTIAPLNPAPSATLPTDPTFIPPAG
jgi:hypothetical protein